MTGILIGTLLFFTRMLGGAAPPEALQIAGQFVFVWNAILSGGAVLSVLWFISRGSHDQHPPRPETAVLSALVTMLGLANALYLRNGKAVWWYAGSGLVLLGSGLLAWGAAPGAFAGLTGAAAIAGGQYLRSLHRREAAASAATNTTGSTTSDTTGSTTDWTAGDQGTSSAGGRQNRNLHTPDGMRYAGSQSVDEEETEKIDREKT